MENAFSLFCLTQTCYNERLLPNHTHTHTHIYIYVCVCVCVCVSMYGPNNQKYKIQQQIKIDVIKKQPTKDYHDYKLNHMSKSYHPSCRALAPVFEKSSTVPKLKSNPKLLWSKYTIHIATFNFGPLNRIVQFSELTASAAEHNIDIACLQERRYYHSGLELKYPDSGNG